MKRNRRILVVFVLIWISVVVYFMYKNDSSEVLVAIDVDRGPRVSRNTAPAAPSAPAPNTAISYTE